MVKHRKDQPTASLPVTADHREACTTEGSAPEPFETEPWSPGEVLFEDFAVEALLGKGGMGVVYLLRRLSTQQRLVAKRARFGRQEDRRCFLTELQTWLDLPAHPHLSPCRFFRTLDNEVILFSDYVAGGSLADWIRRQESRAMDVILDLAIQIAWGLHVVHEHGLIHRDVKPANVLVSTEGEAQITDFGLAQVRSFGRAQGSGDSELTGMVSAGGMTLAYCSPEQARGKRLSRRTDIWSWGICLLEMLIDRTPVCTNGGQHAIQWLNHYRQQQTIPEAVGPVLERCFQVNPEDRWQSMEEAADALIQAYQEITQQVYPRNATPVASDAISGVSLERSTSLGMEWQLPRKWLCHLFQVEGRDPTEVEEVLPPPAETRMAQAAADVAAYEEALLRLGRLVDQGHKGLRKELPVLLQQKAFVHVTAGDLPGAMELMARALTEYQTLIEEGHRELVNPLARCHLHRGTLLRMQGEHRAAIECYEQIFELRAQLRNRRRRREFRTEVAMALLEKGDATRNLGDRSGAMALYEEAIGLWEEMASQEKQKGLEDELARAYLSKAGLQAASGKARMANKLCDEAIRLRRRAIQLEDRRGLRAGLAKAHQVKAQVLRAEGKQEAATAQMDKALALWKQLVHQEGREDLIPDLARCYLNRAVASRGGKDPEMAISLATKAVELLEALVDQEGRRELTFDLARAFSHLATSCRYAGKPIESLSASQRAIPLWEQLVGAGREELLGDLARAIVNQAHATRETGDAPAALALFERAMALREKAPHQDPQSRQGELGRNKIGMAETLKTLDRNTEAITCLQEAIALLEQALESGERRDLRSAWHRAIRLQKQWQ